MHTRTTVWTALRRAKARFAGWEQGRALRDVVRLFAAMVVCTLIARGASGATLAVVDTATPRRAELVQAVTAEAVLSTDDGFDLTLPAGLTLTQILIPAGGIVQAGEALARFDADTVYEALAQAETELARLQLAQDRLSVQQTADGDALAAAETRLARALADRDTQAAQTQAEIVRAQKALAQAEAACDAAQVALDALRGQPDADSVAPAGAGATLGETTSDEITPDEIPSAEAPPVEATSAETTPGEVTPAEPTPNEPLPAEAGSAALAEAETALAAAEAERDRQAVLLEQARSAADAANENAARSVADAGTARLSEERGLV